eukprot:CAMPEP_0184689220 /NCGR_PEP_ID=MMETSP0312-20130426/30535_1 /TAXON_ID=31354 /ORGANISM="Compsopogon coeruleus, Strain SAG 36.94" /LENGTH=774 /DNA_ID=CAMNT_0027146547 /DNA_START=629 /DNA_END=2954 /DNA_ORIENTATION=-
MSSLVAFCEPIWRIGSRGIAVLTGHPRVLDWRAKGAQRCRVGSFRSRVIPRAEQQSKEEHVQMHDVGRAMRCGITVEDRVYWFRTYHTCFIGKEAVEWMVRNHYALTEEDAVRLGNAMMQAGIIHHVLREHLFENSSLLYRFSVDEDHGAQDPSKASYWNSMDPDTTENTGSIQASIAQRVRPFDAFNRQWLDKVRPISWVDPRAKDKYHLVVIGAGAGGLVSAAGAAGVGARVALIEEHLLGGDCLNVGCVPSKTLLASAREASRLRDHARLEDLGLHLDGNVKVDFGRVMERVRSVRADIADNDSAERFSKKLGIDVFLGRGRFTSRNTVEVNGQTLEFAHAVIATGGSPRIPPIQGLQELFREYSGGNHGAAPILTNENIFNLTELPETLGVIGSGPVGIELAQAFQRLGSSVTIFSRGGRILEKEEPDLAQILQCQLERDGLSLQFNVEYEKVEAEPNGIVSIFVRHGSERRQYRFAALLVAAGRVPNVSKLGLESADIDYDDPEGFASAIGSRRPTALLVAAGRVPNVSKLGLESADIDYDESRYETTDVFFQFLIVSAVVSWHKDHQPPISSPHFYLARGVRISDRFETSNPRVYAVGDCTSDIKLTHVADFMARGAVRNALFFGNQKFSDLIIPWCTYTDPEIAHVGIYPSDAKKEGLNIDTYEKWFRDNDRAMTDGPTTPGLVRIHVRQGSDKIVGASIVGPHAGDLISEITLAMRAGVGLGTLASVIHPYPTYADAIRACGDQYNRTRLTPTIRAAFRQFLRLTL